jgi:hypothetical protein
MVNNRLGGTPFGDMRIASIGSAVMTAYRRLKRTSADRPSLRSDLRDRWPTLRFPEIA